MKLDGEQVLCHGNIAHKSDSIPFGYNNISLDSVGLKSGNVIVNEYQGGAFCNLKDRERNADQSQYAVIDDNDWNASKLDCSIRVDASTDDNEKDVRDFLAPIPLSHSSMKVEPFEKESVFYVDKSVMEPELPELVVCYKENTYHVVKDICIDQEVPSQDKFLFNTGKDEKHLRRFLSPEKHINGEIAKEKVGLYMHIPDTLKSSAQKEKSALHLPIPDVFVSSEEKGFKNDYSIESDSKEEEIVNDKSKEIFSLGELLSLPEVRVQLPQPQSLHDTVDKVEQKSIQRPNENTISEKAFSCEESENGSKRANLARHLISKESDCGCEEASSGSLASDCAVKASDPGCDESVITSRTLNSDTDESENGSKEEKMASHSPGSVFGSTTTIENELSDDSKVDTNSITYDLHSITPTANMGGDSYQHGGSEHIETHSSRPDVTSTESFSSQLRCSLGESSFSAAGPPSGLISYSGPIAYSGSLSLRSDSSTTSTRSFAFPILQNEWNSSPVRMAKADRRHSRKHRRWMQGLLCCRF